MKLKIYKRWNYFLFFLVSFTCSCFAFNNSCYVFNQSMIEAIKKTCSVALIRSNYDSPRDKAICCSRLDKISFALNIKDFRKTIASVPVYSRVRGFVGEVITPIEFENVNTVDDVLRAMTSNSETIPKFKLGSVGYKHFWSPRKVLDKYLDQDYLLDFVRNNCETEDDIVTFYEYSPDCIFFKNSFDIDNIKLVCKSTRDNTEYGRFSFKEPGVLKSPLDSSKSVGLLDIILGRYSKVEEYQQLPVSEYSTKIKVD